MVRPAKPGLDDVESRRALRAPRLLFVDDDPYVLEGIRRLLSCLRPSWQVACATHSGEAIARLLCNEFDIIAMGLTLPGTDALGAFARVARRQPRAARVVFSSHLRATSRGPAWRWVQHRLAVPASAGELLQVLEAALPEALRGQVDDVAAG
jgi:DNA-binding NarL/FixJ family response regulator